jgi:hypothetical protein
MGKLACGVPGTDVLRMAFATPAVLGLNTTEMVQDLPAARGRLLHPSAVTTNWASLIAMVKQQRSARPRVRSEIGASWKSFAYQNATTRPETNLLLRRYLIDVGVSPGVSLDLPSPAGTGVFVDHRLGLCPGFRGFALARE